MILNNGNIKSKSKLLHYYMFDNEYPETDLKQIYLDYNDEIKSIPGINNYKNISKYLHDSYIDELIQVNNNVVIKLTLCNYDNDNLQKKKITLIGGIILSQNKILKSGKISRLNKKFMPKEYLYDEFYFDDTNVFITIILTTSSKINTGYYFPLITIKFKSIIVEDL